MDLTRFLRVKTELAGQEDHSEEANSLAKRTR
jgi:hypothetical protein